MYGVISAFGGAIDKLPTGWRPCDGRHLSAIAFAEAYDVLGSLWGAGSPPGPSGFFRLPDLTGHFLRGSDPEGLVDPDAADRTPIDGGTGETVGTVQADAFQGHRHDTEAHYSSTTGFNAQGTAGAGQRFGTGSLDVSEPTDLPGFGEPRFAEETRPVNTAVHWIIYVGTPTGIDLDDEVEARLPVERLPNGQALDARGNVVPG